jgi:serine/threonine protein kinase
MLGMFTENGRQRLVMEYVGGGSWRDLIQKEGKLPFARTLDIVLELADALSRAHHLGIIHRDIKPSNVPVTVADGKPIPKVIDFGIAKATASRLTDKTLFTEFRQLIGTPEYMSPEQAEMSGVDIDSRSDIYSLGVLLYELLTGLTPFDGRTLRSAAFGEMRRIIREVEPMKPSTRLSKLGDTLASVAARRHTEPTELRKQILGRSRFDRHEVSGEGSHQAI